MPDHLHKKQIARSAEALEDGVEFPPYYYTGGGAAIKKPRYIIVKVLYKYYSSLPNDYILNPTIKLTTPISLNDPFENIIPKDLLSFMKKDKYLLALTNEFKNEFSRTDEDIIRIMENGLAHCGIVSLSETQRNLLMWAHYGAQHKGICVGYNENIFEDVLPSSEYNLGGDVPYFESPVKINYDTTRFDPNGSGITHYKGQSIISSILTHVLTTKSDEWIYEKEHRYIVPIIWGDCYYSSKMYFDQENQNKLIDLKSGEYISYVPRMYKLNTKRDENIRLMSANESLIMKRIPSSKIESIYFGCKSDIKQVYKTLDLIQNNKQELGHIRLYRFMESDTRFELEAEPIYLPHKMKK